MERLVFIGPGRVGLSLGYALALTGDDISLVYHGRRPDPPAHPLFGQGLAEYRYGLERPDPDTTAVFLTVPDAVLPELAIALAGRGPVETGCPAFHCSGVLAADALEPLHARGYSVGTLHPFQAVANALSGAERLGGAYFAVSGEPAALNVARRLVARLGGRAMTIPTDRRSLYHAAAVMGSNYLVALLGTAARLLREAGVPPADAEGALLALAQGTLANVLEMGARDGLTGPIMRGDVDTVALHLRAMGSEDAAVYVALGRRTLDLVGDRLDPAVAERFEELFARYA